MRKEVLVTVALAKRKAEQGVDYSSRFGAVCPECGRTKMRVYHTWPWRKGVRVRDHRCDNPECLVCVLGLTIKSTQRDSEAVSA